MKLLAGLSTLDIILLASIGGALLLGLIIFFLAGLHKVPKNHVIVIEKAREFYCIYEKGIHFKMPIIYQKAGVYCVEPLVRKYVANNGNHLDITYQIVDVRKYHEFGQGFEDIMKIIEKENSEINLTTLSNSFEKYGLKFINIKKSLN